MAIGKYGESVRIYNHYTDIRNRLRVRTLCDLLNDVAEMHTIEQKADVATLNKDGFTWMLRRIHLFMPDMPRQEEHVWIETWNPRFSGLLVPRVYKVSSPENPEEKNYRSEYGERPLNGRLRAFAYTDWMMVNLRAMRPERPTERMVSISGLYEEALPFGPSLLNRAEQKAGLVPDASWSRPVEYKASYSDIDFNGHLTQSSYIQRMIDAHDFAFTSRYRMTEIEVVYARELKPDACFVVRFLSEPMENGQIRVTYAVLGAEDPSCLHVWGRALWCESEVSVPVRA